MPQIREKYQLILIFIFFKERRQLLYEFIAVYHAGVSVHAFQPQGIIEGSIYDFDNSLFGRSDCLLIIPQDHSSILFGDV